jgi:hypothetical protein
MASAKIDIDALARQAQRDVKAGVTAPVAQPPREPLSIEVLNAKTLNWCILVEPREISEKLGTGVLVKSEISKEIEEIKTTIGRVIDLGPTALDGKTPSGIQINKVALGIESREDLLGKWVLYQRYTGHAVRNARLGRTVVVLTISELLMVVDNPDDWDCDV